MSIFSDRVVTPLLVQIELASWRVLSITSLRLNNVYLMVVVGYPRPTILFLLGHWSLKALTTARCEHCDQNYSR